MRPTAPLAFAAAAALQAACVRNVDLPAETGVPTVIDFFPQAAYGGELLSVSGSGFDPAPQRNRVEFASGATATGIELRSGALLVRVPRGAGTGPISVSNARGPSAATGTFAYLGGGDLAFGQVARSRVLLHAPTGIASTPDDLFIRSQLWGGVVSMLDKYFDGDGAATGWATPYAGPQMISVSGGTALVWIDRAAGQMVRRLAKGSTTTATAAYGGASFARLCSVEAAGARPELVAEVTWNQAPPPACSGCGNIELTTFHASTLAVVDATRTLALDDFWGVQDGGAGRIALLGVRADASGLPGTAGLYLVRPGVPVDLWVPEPVATPLGRTASQPLAVGRLTNGHSLAAFFDADGDVVTIDLDPVSGTPAFDAGTIGLHALIEFAAGFAATGKWLVASKRTENLILGVDLDARSVAWSASTDSPGPAAGDGSLFKVASLASNDALEIEAATGVVLARRDLGLFPGRNIVHGGLAWCPAVDCGSPKLRIHTEYPVGTLVTTPDESLEGSTGTSDLLARGVAWDGGKQWTWGDDWVETGGTSVTVPGSILHVAADSGGAWVAHSAGLSRVEQGAVAGTSAFTPSELLPPASLPGGGLALAWRTGTSWQVGTWTPADAKAGSAPKTLALARPATATFTVDGVLWVASAAADGSVVQAESMTGSPPRVVDAVALDGPLGDLVAISPNGRMLVAVSPGTRDVLLYRADPEAHFPLVADVAVAGTVTGVAFDESGETAYVITRVPEQLIALGEPAAPGGRGLRLRARGGLLDLLEERPGVVVADLPPASLAHEEVGGDQGRAAREALLADDVGDAPRHMGGGGGAAKVGRVAPEDGAPARHHRLAAAERVPARVHAGDRRLARPQGLEGSDVAGREGRVEGAVDVQDLDLVAGHVALLLPRGRPPARPTASPNPVAPGAAPPLGPRRRPLWPEAPGVPISRRQIPDNGWPGRRRGPPGTHAGASFLHGPRPLTGRYPSNRICVHFNGRSRKACPWHSRRTGSSASRRCRSTPARTRRRARTPGPCPSTRPPPTPSTRPSTGPGSSRCRSSGTSTRGS
jgi:hypothetical protein